MNKIKKGDEVIVLTGKDKGKIGRIIKVVSEGKVLVDGINIVKKTVKANPNNGTNGGIESKEMPIHVSNVGIYNHSLKRADKVGFKTLENGIKVRFFKSTNDVLDV